MSRTRDQLMAAIRINRPATTSGATNSTAPIVKDTLQEGYDNHFIFDSVISQSSPVQGVLKNDQLGFASSSDLETEINKQLLSDQLYRMRREITGGVKIYNNQGRSLISEPQRTAISVHIDSTLDSVHEEYNAFVTIALQNAFGENWYKVIVAHTQEPAYFTKRVVNSVIESTTFQLDTVGNYSVQLSPMDGNHPTTCAYVTRIERVRLIDPSIQDSNGNFKEIGILEGPLISVHLLKPVEETLKGHVITVWKYQLDRIESPNPLLLELFEGKTISPMQLFPAYAAVVTKQHAELTAACNQYLNKLLIRLGFESGELLLRSHPVVQQFPGLEEAIRWCLTDKKTALPANHARVLEGYANASMDTMEVIKNFISDPNAIFASTVKQAVLLVRLRDGLMTSTIDLPERIKEFEKLLVREQASLLEKPTNDTKRFAQAIKECFPGAGNRIQRLARTIGSPVESTILFSSKNDNDSASSTTKSKPIFKP